MTFFEEYGASILKNLDEMRCYSEAVNRVEVEPFGEKEFPLFRLTWGRYRRTALMRRLKKVDPQS